MQAPQPGNKYIVGWLTLRPGSEGAFDQLSRPYIAICRTEPACRFFEMIRMPETPLTVLVTECFETAEAHLAHLETPHFDAFWESLHKIALVGTFENVIAGTVNPDGYDFANRLDL